MGRYLKFEENDDNSMTMSTNMFGEEEIYLIPGDFSQFLHMTEGLVSEQVLEDFSDTMVLIPNSAEGVVD